MLTLSIFNTLSHKKDPFEPLMLEAKNGKKEVGIYSCGPTVYGTPHIGNLRAYIFADTLRNTIKHILGYPVKHIVNITDVGHLTSDSDQGEDKMEKSSQKTGETVWDIAMKYENIFKDNLKKLNIDDFDAYPRATAYIKEQISMVKDLINKKYTYSIENDGIYMDTNKVRDYGKLLPPGHLEGLKKGARVDTEGKKNITDFALWKFSKQDENRQMERFFDGPQSGELVKKEDKNKISENEKKTIGFPGWHIECSAMSRSLLGDHFDIHTGGIDHIPIHHTNEIAQSECCYAEDHKRVKYRMHCQFLNISGEKISKSLGNSITLEDIIDQGFDPLDLRYRFFTAHYRNFLDFSWEHLEAAKNTRKNLIKKCSQLGTPDFKDEIYNLPAEEFLKTIKNDGAKKYFKDICETLCDDLNISGLLVILQYFLNEDFGNDSLKIIAYFDYNILKLNLFESKTNIQENIPENIKQLAEQRWYFKQNKNFTEADKMRKEILELGYEIFDTKDSYEIKKT